MEKFNQLIEIVKDPQKKKLRARCLQDGRWNRFPNKLRKLNKIFLAGKMSKGRGDSWCASQITEFPITSEKNEKLEQMLNIDNKRLLKLFYQNIYEEKTKKVNTEMLNIIFIVKQIIPDIDQQILEPLIQKYNHNAFISQDLIVPLQNMFCHYQPKRIVKLFSNYKEDDFLEDTVAMYSNLLENNININEAMPKKPKSIRELHQLFSQECTKINRPNNKLKQELPHLEGKSVDKFQIFIPYTSKELIEIGAQLNICVGNGLYAKKITGKKCNIIALMENNKFKWCIEFNKNRLIQARGYCNRDMDRTLKEKLKSIIYK